MLIIKIGWRTESNDGDMGGTLAKFFRMGKEDNNLGYKEKRFFGNSWGCELFLHILRGS